MRILVVSERLSDNDDDGIKNIALAFLREGQRLGHEMTGFSEWAAIPELNIQLIKTNRWYSDARLRDQIRSINPDLIVYVPWTSATARSLVRLSNLQRYAGGASTIIVATQPMPYRWFERMMIPFVKPDLAIVMSPTTQALLRRQGIRTWFMPAGYYPERCQPQPEQREKLQAMAVATFAGQMAPPKGRK